MYQAGRHERGRDHRHDRGREGRHRHPQEQWEDQRQQGYRGGVGGGFPEGSGPMQRGYATQPMAERLPHGYQQQQQQGYPVAGYDMQPGPRYQQIAAARWSPPRGQVAVSGPGYQQHGGYPTEGYQQRGYAPRAQDGPAGSGYQQPQQGHMSRIQDRPDGYQQPQGGYMDAHNISGHQQPQSEYPAQVIDEFRNPSYQTYPVDSQQAGISSRIQNHDLRLHNGQQDHQGMKGDVARTNGHSYGTDNQKDKRSSDGGKWFSRVSGHRRQDRHSSPGDMLKEGSHPVRRRRVVSDARRRQRNRKSGQVQIVNPMGMRLRRCLPDFDFAAFAEQLNDEELKEFDTHQPVIPEPDYSDEEEEEEGEGEEEEEKDEEVKEELDEDDQERKDSEIDLQWTTDEKVDRGARESVSIEKSRPKSKKKKSERRQFVKETTGLMKDELVFFISFFYSIIHVYV